MWHFSDNAGLIKKIVLLQEAGVGGETYTQLNATFYLIHYFILGLYLHGTQYYLTTVVHIVVLFSKKLKHFLQNVVCQKVE